MNPPNLANLENPPNLVNLVNLVNLANPVCQEFTYPKQIRHRPMTRRA